MAKPYHWKRNAAIRIGWTVFLAVWGFGGLLAVLGGSGIGSALGGLFIVCLSAVSIWGCWSRRARSLAAGARKAPGELVRR